MVAAIALTTGCASQDQMWDLNDQARITPEDYTTPMADAMQCSAETQLVKGRDFRLGIGIIGAEDGVFDYESQGKYTPNSAHHMMITALKASGFRVMNRLGEVTTMMEWENAKSMDKLLGDGKSNYVDAQRPMRDYDGEIITNKMGNQVPETYKKEIRHRILTHGQMLGSTHLLSGAITRLDFDTSSGGFELYVNGVGAGKRVYRMLIGMDMHVTNTITGEIEWAKAYDKQFFGVEIAAGVFRMIDGEMVDLNTGVETGEPIQTGVHYLVDYIAYDMSREFRGVAKFCDDKLPQPEVEVEHHSDEVAQQDS